MSCRGAELGTGDSFSDGFVPFSSVGVGKCTKKINNVSFVPILLVYIAVYTKQTHTCLVGSFLTIKPEYIIIVRNEPTIL